MMIWEAEPPKDQTLPRTWLDAWQNEKLSWLQGCQGHLLSWVVQFWKNDVASGFKTGTRNVWCGRGPMNADSY